MARGGSCVVTAVTAASSGLVMLNSTSLISLSWDWMLDWWWPRSRVVKFRVAEMVAACVESLAACSLDSPGE